ncbi:hypothetical protein NE237_015783 [Protea cynaroides]|uniref:BHLH transcription factor n=1 Tax=Protea cynaroides TaxID=273540 RepID=A0A9Q0KEN4_9MAGN|nr:hypothetical protein NE237_015783 [Protea cynaroides]
MGTYWRESLRSLCFKTKWKYAVFWKLKHQGRLILTWEDAYYNNHELPDHSENTCYIDTLLDFNDGRYQQDPLGLALAKMTYAVYPLGEGIVGRVAASGTHQWISADRPASGSWSSSEYCDEWQTQFSAGIRTIAVVAVTPLGVVQLGSLDTVFEDLNLVSHIKDTFFSLQTFSMRFLPDPLQYSMKTTSSLSEISTKTSDVEIIKDSLGILDEGVSNIKPDTQPSSLPCFGRYNNFSHVLPLSNLCPKEAVEMVDKQMKLKRKKCEEDTNGWKDLCLSPRCIHPLVSHNFCTEDTNLNKFMLESGVRFPFQHADSLVSMTWEGAKCDRVSYLQNEELHASQPFEIRRRKCLKPKLELPTQIKHVDTVNTLLDFSAGFELQEALGPAYIRQEELDDAWHEALMTETGVPIVASEGMGISQFISECGADHLLEAVVANACLGVNSVKNGISFCKLSESESVVTTEKSPQTSMHAKHACVSLEGSNGVSSLVEDANYQLTSTWGSTEVQIRACKELSSTTVSRCGEQSGRQMGPAKVSKKRARSGETCRPRPRDRQLFQNHIRDLRELVPNGLKCGIDSLLERTFKHILFLQTVTKHADNLKKCAESMLHDKGIDLLGSCRSERGSSWVLEVGGSETVCPIVVKNLNMNRQMLVEMLCKECNFFFDIGEALRGLGLTILKGVTEVRGEKTWASFVVESNKGFHRMDILWSLMPLLQPKTTI